MKTILFLLWLAPLASLHAQTEQALTERADKLEAALNETGALETFKQVLKLNPANYYALWKCSELCSRLCHRQTSDAARTPYLIAAKKYALTAIQMYPRNADGYYTLAVALGVSALNESGQQRIESVKEIRSNAEKAVQINPQHGRAWFVLGRWNYEVSNLNMLERAAVRLLYGGLPSASLEQSIRAYEKAMLYEPGFILNFFELARAYKRYGNINKAIDLLKRIPSLPNQTGDDSRLKEESRKLLQKWLDEL